MKKNDNLSQDTVVNCIAENKQNENLDSGDANRLIEVPQGNSGNPTGPQLHSRGASMKTKRGK